MISNKTQRGWRQLAYGVVSAMMALALTYAFFAHAATNLYTNASFTIDDSNNFASGDIDASTYENLSLEFDYDAEELDNGDSVSYGWSDGLTYTELGTINGANESGTGTSTASDEIGSVNVSLPVGAQVSTLEIQMTQTNFSSGDFVDFTNLTVSGDEIPKTESTVEITGDTSSGENQPGWLFNRDTNNATPIQFNEDEASIGSGSLYVEPLTSEAARKFIGEYFIFEEIANIDSISYDFLIGSGGDSSDENEFYLNVYANYGESDEDKYYDCKYDVVPTVGSTGSFTTITFDPTQSYPVTTLTGKSWAPDSPYTCPSVPADMDTQSPGSIIRMFAINMGDTSAGDAGLDGYFDNVVVETNTTITTFDFEADTTKPNVSITSHSSGDVIGTSATFAGAASDEGTGIESVDYTVTEVDAIGGSYVANVDSGSATGLEDWSVDVAGLTDGFYRFKVTAKDGAGNTRIKYVDVEVDDTKPTAQIVTPAHAAVFDNVEIEVEGTASDSQSGISEVLYTVSEIDSIGGSYVATVATGTANGTENWDFDIQSLDDGFYRIKIQAFDGIGNWRYDYHDIQVSGNKPNVVIIYPENAAVLYTGSFTVNGTSSDDATEIVEVKYTVNEIDGIGGTYVASGDAGTATGTEEWNFEVIDLDEGFYRLKVQAFDAFGNWRYRYHDVEVTSRDLYLEITNPTVDYEEVAAAEQLFTATYWDDDDTVDTINWAIKPGSCEANDLQVNILGYGTDGYTVASYDPETGEIEVNLDLSDFEPGDYCFVVNPAETGGESDTDREIRLFTIPEPPTEASLEIVTPTLLETISSTYDFTAEYIDDDETEDAINWAIYFESCSFTGSNRVAGNAEGDTSSFGGTTFSTTLLTSSWEDGEYCFVVNPSEQSGEDDLRATQIFFVDNSVEDENSTSTDDTNGTSTEEFSTSSSGSSSSGTRVGLQSANVQPLVLGASTSQCGKLLSTYMEMGGVNDVWEVMKLQAFLVGQGYFDVKMTGTFDLTTHNAVIAYQELHKAEILTPWVTAGLSPNDNPTGKVYLLTRWKINNTICPGSEAFPTLHF